MTASLFFRPAAVYPPGSGTGYTSVQTVPQHAVLAPWLHACREPRQTRLHGHTGHSLSVDSSRGSTDGVDSVVPMSMLSSASSATARQIDNTHDVTNGARQ